MTPEQFVIYFLGWADCLDAQGGQVPSSAMWHHLVNLANFSVGRDDPKVVRTPSPPVMVVEGFALPEEGAV